MEINAAQWARAAREGLIFHQLYCRSITYNNTLYLNETFKSGTIRVNSNYK